VIDDLHRSDDELRSVRERLKADSFSWRHGGGSKVVRPGPDLILIVERFERLETSKELIVACGGTLCRFFETL
jgi:hypothetical protein